MFDRFTDRARKVMQLANIEAQRFNHEYIGTEHILLGLIKESSGVAATVLKNLDVDLRVVRSKIEELIQAGPPQVIMGKLPQTPRSKRVIEFSMDAARELNHNHVGTEHMLIGLLREKDGVAFHVLESMDITEETILNDVYLLLGVEREPEVKVLKCCVCQEDNSPERLVMIESLGDMILCKRHALSLGRMIIDAAEKIDDDSTENP